MTVEIDERSGFCGGVIKAIDTAEKFLDTGNGILHSLGAIVHNDEELNRLASKGLAPITYDDLDSLEKGSSVLIRAHGEPPQVYARLKEFAVIDCTCPVVLKLQKEIREAYNRVKSDGTDGTVVIFGKIGHPEVLGLVGQVAGDAVTVENAAQLKEALSKGRINTRQKVELFSQTTMSPEGYAEISAMLEGVCPSLTVHNTICSQVAGRHKILSSFAESHDVIVFVAGKTSSNGKVLSALCRSINPRTYELSDPSELCPDWFRATDRVGVCGATSTPKWLLEKVAQSIENLHK